ncbi:MAG: hypothetical protein IRZ28_11975 [Steroidobacteraceae bacterium]|nr:hypothetical protein [Steroidobacteraceae bacterium]
MAITRNLICFERQFFPEAVVPRGPAQPVPRPEQTLFPDVVTRGSEVALFARELRGR